MSSLLICGDPHGQFQPILDRLAMDDVDGVILLGDLELNAPLQQVFKDVIERVAIYWVPGNHDTDSERVYDHLFGSELSQGNLHGKVTTIGKVRVAGLGGVFRGRVWDGFSNPVYASPSDFVAHCGKGNLWRGGLPLRHRSTIFPSDIAALRGCKADVLVTHEAPSHHPLGNVALTEVASELGASCAFHGHHHERREYPGGVWYGVGAADILRLEIDEETSHVSVHWD